MRCKFICASVTKRRASQVEGDFTYDVTFDVVTATSPENCEFFRWTPFGVIKFSALNVDDFIPGQEYYVDFTPCAPV